MLVVKLLNVKIYVLTLKLLLTTCMDQWLWVQRIYPDSKFIKKYNKTDYFLILHVNEKKILKNYYKTKFITVGSLRNTKLNLKKKNSLITYISDYSKPPEVSEKSYCGKIDKMFKDYCISKIKNWL